jgi:TRAP-type C4-dicarboxylate transport system permease small subunit
MQARGLFSAVENVIHRISRWIRLVSQATLFIMMFLVTAAVFARYVLNRPLKGDIEIQELMMVLIVFLALPYCQLEKGNVYVEILAKRFKGRLKDISHSFVYLIGFIIIILIVWQIGVRVMKGFAAFHEHVTLSLWIPITPFVAIATIGFALMGLEWLIELIHSIRRTVVSIKTDGGLVPVNEISGSNSK